MYDSSRRRDILTITNNARGAAHKTARLGVLSDANVSTLEKALMTGGIHETPSSLSQTDLVGIDRQALAAIFDAAHPQAKVHVLCVGLPDAPKGMVAVLRIVFPSDVSPASAAAAAGGGGGGGGGSGGLEGAGGAVEGQGNNNNNSSSSYIRALIRPVMEMVMSLGCAVVHVARHLTENHRQVTLAASKVNKAVKDQTVAAQQLDRARKMHKVVCREAMTLLDPPMVGPGGHAPRAVHPASLTPLAASQDSCAKLLVIARSLLLGEGQALLLRDPTTEPCSFQVIFSGSALNWAGVEQGSFGLAGSASQNSLAEACMHSHRTVAVDNGPADPRYNSLIDGSCAQGSPMLFVPVRGRGSAVVGCLVVARAKGASAFTSDDLAAAELVASHGALTLYWCQGLGSLHHVLTKNVLKMEELERAVTRLSSGVGGISGGGGGGGGGGGVGGGVGSTSRTTQRERR